MAAPLIRELIQNSERMSLARTFSVRSDRNRKRKGPPPGKTTKHTSTIVIYKNYILYSLSLCIIYIYTLIGRKRQRLPFTQIALSRYAQDEVFFGVFMN